MSLCSKLHQQCFGCRTGSWVAATEEGEAEDQDEEMVDAQPSSDPAAEEQEHSMIREAAIGKGNLPLIKVQATFQLPCIAMCCVQRLLLTLRYYGNSTCNKSCAWCCMVCIASKHALGKQVVPSSSFLVKYFTQSSHLPLCTVSR